MQDQLVQLLEVGWPVLLPMYLACAAAWVWMLARWVRARPVIPYEPRRRVPWRGGHVLFITLVFFSVGGLAAWLDGELLGPRGGAVAETQASETDEGGGDRTRDHKLTLLVRAAPGPVTWTLAVLTAVVVAPIVEEFLFRLLVQGWLESVEWRLRRRVPGLRRIVPGLLPVVLVSLVFAASHFHAAEAAEDATSLMRTMIWTVVIGVVTLLIAVGVLRDHAGASAADLGVVWKKVPRDVVIGLVAFAAVGVFIWAVQLTAFYLVPPAYAPDPIPLFPFALVLGLLYYRTHRIVPSIVLHMALNGSTMLILWLAVRAGV